MPQNKYLWQGICTLCTKLHTITPQKKRCLNSNELSVSSNAPYKGKIVVCVCAEKTDVAELFSNLCSLSSSLRLVNKLGVTTIHENVVPLNEFLNVRVVHTVTVVIG